MVASPKRTLGLHAERTSARLAHRVAVGSHRAELGLITRLQAPGGKAMPAADYFRGHPIQIQSEGKTD